MDLGGCDLDNKEVSSNEFIYIVLTFCTQWAWQFLIGTSQVSEKYNNKINFTLLHNRTCQLREVA